MKRLLAIFLVLLLALTGCSGSKDSETDQIEDSKETETEKTSEKGEKEKDNIIVTDNGEEIDISNYEEDTDLINYEFLELDDGTYAITKYNGSVKYLILPTEFDGKKVTEVSGAFRHSSLVGVIIPEGYIEISGNCFQDSTKLETVIMADSITILGSNGYGHFEECSSLKNIRLSRGLTEITNDMFKECTSLETMYIPGNIQLIDDDAFDDCESLESVTFEEGIIEIDSRPFAGNEMLYDIYLPESVTYIEGDFANIHPNVTFHVVEGSYAEQYANEHSFRVEYTD